MKTKKLLATLTLISVVLFTGCKKDEYLAKVGVCPLVVSTIPANGAVGIPLNQVVSATFNEQMSPETITSSSFTLTSGTTLAGMKAATVVTGTVTYTGMTASFTPSSPLTPNTTFTGRVKATVKDLMGNALQTDYVWSFTTGIPPTVISTDPATSAISVILNKVVTATFNVPMDPLTINATSFNLKQGTTLIAGTVTYTGTTATLTTTSALMPNTVYTATITNGAKNVTGIPMANDYVWTFSTGISPTVISTDPINNAIGVILNKIVTATFSVPMNPLTLTTTTFSLKQGSTAIAGSVTYSGSTASFTPTITLTPNTVYTGTITTGAKNVTGLPLATDYTWTFTTGISPTVILTSPLTIETGVLVNKVVTATFSVPMDILTITGANFTLKQGTNLVAGTVSYLGSTASFTPTTALTPNTVYTGTITTGVKNVAGIPLAANYIWTFTTMPIPAPSVLSSDPANNATGVLLNKIVSATFSVPMDPLTLTAATFTLKQGTIAVAGVVTYSGSTVFFTPTIALNPNTIYTGTITAGVKNVGGISLVNNYIWTFTTRISPTVLSTDPAINATGVVLNKIVAATFSVLMDLTTITGTTFTLKQGTTAIAGAVTYSGSTASFTPAIALTPNTVYTGTITSGAKSIFGIPLASDYIWTFTTGASPTVINTDPANNSTGVVLNKIVAATFSVPMDPLTMTGATFTLKQGTNSVAGIVSYLGSTASFTPAIALTPNTVYTGTITSGAKNVQGIPMASDYIWTFTTGNSPTVISTDPANNSTGVVLNKIVAATFSVPMDPLTMTGTTFTLKQGTNSVAGTVSYLGLTVSFTPTTALTPNTVYTGTITTGAKNVAGIPLANDFVWNFTTIAISSYTLDVTAINGSVVKNPNQVTYNSGTTVLLTATPNSGYTFSSWSGDATGSINPMTVTMNSSKNITANFTANASTFTLVVSAVNGIVYKFPNKTVFNSGETVQLIPTPYSGFVFKSWGSDATGYANPLTITMNSNKTVTANFVLKAVSPLGVDLGSAADFAVLAGSGVSNTGITTRIIGDVGSFPTATINGLLPVYVTGLLYTSASPIVGTAKNDLTTAYNDAQSRSLNAISLPGQLGGLTLAPGLYVNSTSTGISGTGSNAILTLDAQGDAGAVWIFKMGSTLITDAGTSIVLAGGAQQKNIYWSVGTSATLGTSSVFYGNILADQAITLTTGAKLYGRALTRIAAVTLDSNIITKP